MKRVLLAGVGILALATTAVAADLPARRYDPVPQRQPVFMQGYNWSGFYLGINGGAGWGRSHWTSTGSFDVDGWLLGITAGYNWQGGPWVLGLEGDINWSDISGETTAFCPAGCETKNSWLATVRGRVGYAFDRFMPYVTGGLALGDIRARQPGFSTEETKAGYTVGGGFEFAIAGNVTAKAEYLYVDLGKFNCNLGCGNGFNPDRVKFHTHLVRGGVNFRF